MIRVNKKFYESGCTMEGKGNRLMLKKDGETCIEMTFKGGDVEIKNQDGEKHLIEFYKICEITIAYKLPAVRWKD